MPCRVSVLYMYGNSTMPFHMYLYDYLKYGTYIWWGRGRGSLKLYRLRLVGDFRHIRRRPAPARPKHYATIVIYSKATNETHRGLACTEPNNRAPGRSTRVKNINSFCFHSFSPTPNLQRGKTRSSLLCFRTPDYRGSHPRAL